MATSSSSSSYSTPAAAPKSTSLSDASNADLTLALLGHLIESVDHVATMVPSTAGLHPRVRTMTAAFKALKDSLHPPPPTQIDVPAVTPMTATVGDALTCTTGNWEGEPSGYAYLWSNGATGESYTTVAADAGTSLSCTVTATNAAGSTVAATSNAVPVSAAAGAMAATASTSSSASAEKK